MCPSPSSSLHLPSRILGSRGQRLFYFISSIPPSYELTCGLPVYVSIPYHSSSISHFPSAAARVHKGQYKPHPLSPISLLRRSRRPVHRPTTLAPLQLFPFICTITYILSSSGRPTNSFLILGCIAPLAFSRPIRKPVVNRYSI